MNENDEARMMIGRALDNEPRLGIDYESVRSAGRRRLARRHAGIIGGAVLGVVAVATVAVTVGQLAASPSNAPVGPAALSTPKATPPPAGCAVQTRTRGPADAPADGQPPRSVPATPHNNQPNMPESDGSASPAELAESGRLTEAFGRFDFPAPAGVTVEPAALKLCANDTSWEGNLTLHGPGGERFIHLEVRPRAGQPAGECFNADEPVTCSIVKPDGASVRVKVSPPHDPTDPAIVYVDAWRSDGTVVRVTETGKDGKTAAPRILDDNALIAIATAPELKVNWTEPLPTRPAEPSDRRALELTDVLTKALPPGMTGEPRNDKERSGVAFYVSQGSYNLSGTLTDSAGAGSLIISLSSPDSGGPDKVDCVPEEGVLKCDSVPVPNTRKATLSRRLDGAGPGIFDLVLTAVGTDGTHLVIQSSNMSARVPPAKATRAQPSLSADDLIRIAGLSALRW